MKHKEMKSVLVSIKPKYCEKIFHEIGWCMPSAKGKKIYEKRIEVRKSKPNEVPFKAYIYCTGGKLLFKSTDGNLYISKYFNYNGQEDAFNCKVIGEFVCDKVDEYIAYKTQKGSKLCKNPFFYACLPIQEMCLTIEQVETYGKGKTVYCWHISELKLYDKPKELGNFFTHMGKRPSYMIERPPQSWQYVEELCKEQN